MLGGLITTGGIIAAILSIIVGIVIIVWPKLIAYLIGGYFIVFGIIALVAFL